MDVIKKSRLWLWRVVEITVFRNQRREFSLANAISEVLRNAANIVFMNYMKYGEVPSLPGPTLNIDTVSSVSTKKRPP